MTQTGAPFAIDPAPQPSLRWGAVPSAASPPHEHAPRNPALDGLRGAAALLIFLFHYGGGLRSHHPVVRAFGELTQAGWIGLSLFFALSGFLITGVLWDAAPQPHRLRNFYARRALRILPLYLFALLLTVLIPLLAHRSLPRPGPLLISALFLQNLPGLVEYAQSGPHLLPTYHLWSLAVEEQFYLLWPVLLLRKTRRQALTLCLSAFGLCVLFRCGVFLPQSLRPFATAECGEFLLTRAGPLALGGAVALLLRTPNPPQLRRPATVLAVVAFAAFLAVGWGSGSFALASPLQYVVGLPAIGIASAALLALLLHRGWLSRCFSATPLRALGRISYGFYVFHVLLMPLYDALGRAITHTTSGFPYQTARMLAAFPLTVIAAALSWKYLEAPFLRLKTRLPLSPPGTQTRTRAL